MPALGSKTTPAAPRARVPVGRAMPARPVPANRPVAAAATSPLDGIRAKVNHYADGLRVDKQRLDDELIEQPERYFHVSELVAEATSYRDEAKERIVVVSAQADSQARHDFEVAGETTTEPKVKAAISQDVNVVAAMREYNAWRLLAARVDGLRSSFESRGKMLGKLVDLHGQNYFGGATGGSARRAATDRVAADVRARSEE